ncbi:MAG: FKBP-type peptidyl-prolyl cis-trans isomerase [Candidatus Micrarchaeota archaeon]
MRYAFVMLLFGILLLGCVNPPPAVNETNGTTVHPVITTPNGTQQPANQTQNVSYVLPPGYVLSEGDLAAVWYTLLVDGKVYDTNNATLANESGIYSPSRSYVPLTFTVGFDKGLINGFILNVLGMSINETVIFNVKPELGYGIHTLDRVITVPRYYNKSMYEVVPRSYFEENGLEVSNGTGYDSPYGQVFINDFNDDNVTLMYLMQPGQKFTLNNAPQKVVSISNLTATIEFDFDVNKTYVLPDPQTGAGTRFTVVDKTEQEITLDANHPLAGKNLTFQVTLIDAIPAAYR